MRVVQKFCEFFLERMVSWTFFHVSGINEMKSRNEKSNILFTDLEGTT